MINTNLSEINRKLKKHLMEVNEMKETFAYLVTEQQSNYAVKSLIGMVMEYITLLEIISDKENVDMLQQDEVFTQALQAIKHFLSKPDKWMQYDNAQKYNYLGELQAVRHSIIKRVRVLSAYGDSLEIYTYLTDKAIQKLAIKTDQVEDITPQNFAAETVQFIFDQKDNLIINEKLKAVLWHLPLRITKQKFYDYVTKSIGKYYGAYLQDLKDFIHMVSDTFYPEQVEGYNEFYPTISQGLNGLKKGQFNNIKKDEITDIQNETYRLTDDVEYMLNVYHFTIAIVNKIIAILKSTEISYEALSIKEPSLDTVVKILNMIKSAVQEEKTHFVLSQEIIEQLTMLEGKQERWFDTIGRYAGVLQYAEDEYSAVIRDLDVTEAFNNIKTIELLNSENLFIDIDAYLQHNHEQSQVDNTMINQKAQEFIQFLEAKVQEMPRDIRRAKMRQLMSILPPGFDHPEQVHEYILNAVDLCGDKCEILLAADEISKLAEQYNY